MSYRPVTRAEAKVRVLALLSEAHVAGDVDLLVDAIVKAVLGAERKTLPTQTTCAGCGRTKVPIKVLQANPDLRAAGCVQHGRGDYCSACYRRQLRGASGPADPTRAKRFKPTPTAFPIPPSLIAQLRAADPEYAQAAR